jgi:hypothetical protein
LTIGQEWSASSLWLIGLFVGINTLFRGFNRLARGLEQLARAEVTRQMAS